MLMQRKSAFSRRLPDLVTEELVAALSKKGSSFEFKQLFDVVHERLRAPMRLAEAKRCFACALTKNFRIGLSRNGEKERQKYRGLASLSKALTPPAELAAVGK